MSAVSEQLRQLVVARAGNCCEYCGLPAVGQVARFPIDHIIARDKGGRTELGNLALACPSCNGFKWAYIDGLDPVTGDLVPLFNPRSQIWHDHFQWSMQNFWVLEGKTATARATIARLQMNNDEMIVARQLLAALHIPLGPVIN